MGNALAVSFSLVEVCIERVSAHQEGIKDAFSVCARVPACVIETHFDRVIEARPDTFWYVSVRFDCVIEIRFHHYETF